MRIAALLMTGLLAVSASACVSSAQPGEAHAARDGFTYLGEKVVIGANQHDVITVGKADGRFTAIMLVCENAPVGVDEVHVTFGDGQLFEPKLRFGFAPGSTSRVIDLPGGARVIKQVDLVYRGLAPQDSGKIELWGRP
ncbi:MAG TPA: hypothetical protein VGM88_06275 [Kofleriaceae bacterium]|jgi:hypothetical protein